MQTNQWLLKFLQLKIVVNDRSIYPLKENKPVVISLPTNPTKVVITDGYHITKPMNLAWSKHYVQYFKVVCVIDNAQFTSGFIITLILFGMGLSSGLTFLQILSILPVIYFLFLYYIRREKFIRIQPI